MADSPNTPSQHLCSKCNSEMEKGFIDQGLWLNDKSFLGISANIGRSLTTTFLSSNKVSSYKCTKCGFIENYAEPD
jgi:DNA-directed RNA polymerase subunit RPC12/RpoP